MARFLLRIWRRLRAEIVLGFLIATVFWIGILAWQTAYAPTDAEKQKCYEAAQQSGRQREECETLWERTTSDPVAFFTFWLVVFTGILGASTILLWLAGERQFRQARLDAEAADFHRTAQFEQIAEQIEALRDSASAAEDHASQTRELVWNSHLNAQRQLRAYVLPKNGRLDRTGSILRARITLENGGQTPAYDIVYQGRVFIVPPEDPEEIGPFTSVKFVLGPKAESGIYIFSRMPYTAADESEYQSGRLKVIVKGTIKYRDAFDKSQTTEFGFEAFGDIWASRGHLRPIEGDYNIT